MKKLIFLLLVSTFKCFFCFSQDLNYVKSINIYFIPYEMELKVEVLTKEELQNRFFYNLIVRKGFNKNINCEEKISSYIGKSKLFKERNKDTLTQYTLRMYVLIEYSNSNKQDFCFDLMGNFNTNNKWYKRNDELLNNFLIYFRKNCSQILVKNRTKPRNFEAFLL